MTFSTAVLNEWSSQTTREDCNSHQEWPILREDIPSSLARAIKSAGTFPALMYDKVTVCFTFLHRDTCQRNGGLVADKKTLLMAVEARQSHFR